MKIFGKRTKKVPLDEEQKSPTKAIAEEASENVTSYFSPNFRPASAMEEKKAKKETDAANEIKILLGKDPTTLNAKERRLIRRHNERTTEPNSEPQEKAAEEKVNDADKEVNSEDASMTNEDSTAPVSNETSKTNEKEMIASIPSESLDNAVVCDKDTTSASSATEEQNLNTSKTLQKEEQNSSVEEKKVDMETTDNQNGEEQKTADDSSLPLLDRLQGLNSKQRRNLLRKIQREQEEQGDEVDVGASENVLAVAELEARKVAERNRALEREELDKTLQKKRKSKALTESQIKKKKKLAADLSHLPQEERARRENQRKMQKEAADRRARGEVTETRHPLNSERRRANRRKPPGVRGGKKDKVVALVKKDEKANYAAGGYSIRKFKGSNP